MAKYGLVPYLMSIVVFFCIKDYNVFAEQPDFDVNYTRNLSATVVNQNCNDSRCDTAQLAHTSAIGSDDELHHLFSTIGSPTLMMTRTIKGSTFKVNYTELFLNSGRSINFTDAIQSFGIVFSHLYEFDDKQDVANLTNYQNDSSLNIKHDLDQLVWMVISNSSGDYNELVLNATNYTNPTNTSTLFNKGGYISFRLRYDKGDGRVNSNPHMEHTANSSVVTVVMSNLNTAFQHSRFAIEMILFSSGPENDADFSSVTVDESLDDEYSPGVFQMNNWVTDKGQESGYVQWKPVMYTKPETVNDNINHAWSYLNAPENRTQLLNRVPARGLLHCFFGDGFPNVSFNATNVSFGVTNDKFYANTGYLVWSLSAGLGPVPSDDVSTLVILVIAIGLGIPLILMIVSAVYVCVKNRRKNAYESINE